MAKKDNTQGKNPDDVRAQVEGNASQREDENPLITNQQEALANHNLNAAVRQANAVDADQEALAAVREEEAALQQKLTAKVDREGAQETRNLVYETADKSSGSAVRPLSNEGSPLTQFEEESQWFFKEQNELEAQIDAVQPSREAQAAFAGTVVNVFQTGELGPVGSATVTNYTGETIHPYPPTDYNAAAIVSDDLTADPVLGQLGLVATNPMPPENNVHDIRETDGRIDTKDFSRRLRVPNDLIVESRRTKYPSNTEDPAP